MDIFHAALEEQMKIHHSNFWFGGVGKFSLRVKMPIGSPKFCRSAVLVVSLYHFVISTEFVGGMHLA